jgi:hypothetical protein
MQSKSSASANLELGPRRGGTGCGAGRAQNLYRHGMARVSEVEPTNAYPGGARKELEAVEG